MPEEAQAAIGSGLALISDKEIKYAARKIIRLEFSYEMLKEIRDGKDPLTALQWRTIYRARRRLYALPRDIAAGKPLIHKRDAAVAWEAEVGGYWILQRGKHQKWIWIPQLHNEDDWKK